MKKQEILVIGVLYNTFKEAECYLDSLGRAYVPGLQVILVDNSEKVAPEDFQEHTRKYDFVKLVRPERNLGYLQGARFGYEYAVRTLGADPLWVFITNVDISFEDNDLFDRLSRFEAGNEWGMIAPSIISARFKKDLNPYLFSRYSVSRMRFYSFLYRSVLLTGVYTLLSHLFRLMNGILYPGQHKSTGDPPFGIQPVYAPHGACMIIHRNFFDKGGTLDFPTFLFGEEIFIGEELRKLDLKSGYAPWMRISTHEHASTGWFHSSRMVRHNRESIEALIKAYYA